MGKAEGKFGFEFLPHFAHAADSAAAPSEIALSIASREIDLLLFPSRPLFRYLEELLFYKRLRARAISL